MSALYVFPVIQMPGSAELELQAPYVAKILDSPDLTYDKIIDILYFHKLLRVWKKKISIVPVENDYIVVLEKIAIFYVCREHKQFVKLPQLFENGILKTT